MKKSQKCVKWKLKTEKPKNRKTENRKPKTEKPKNRKTEKPKNRKPKNASKNSDRQAKVRRPRHRPARGRLVAGSRRCVRALHAKFVSSGRRCTSAVAARRVWLVRPGSSDRSRGPKKSQDSISIVDWVTGLKLVRPGRETNVRARFVKFLKNFRRARRRSRVPASDAFGRDKGARTRGRKKITSSIPIDECLYDQNSFVPINRRPPVLVSQSFEKIFVEHVGGRGSPRLTRSARVE